MKNIIYLTITLLLFYACTSSNNSEKTDDLLDMHAIIDSKDSEQVASAIEKQNYDPNIVQTDENGKEYTIADRLIINFDDYSLLSSFASHPDLNNETRMKFYRSFKMNYKKEDNKRLLRYVYKQKEVDLQKSLLDGVYKILNDLYNSNDYTVKHYLNDSEFIIGTMNNLHLFTGGNIITFKDQMHEVRKAPVYKDLVPSVPGNELVLYVSGPSYGEMAPFIKIYADPFQNRTNSTPFIGKELLIFDAICDPEFIFESVQSLNSEGLHVLSNKINDYNPDMPIGQIIESQSFGIELDELGVVDFISSNDEGKVHYYLKSEKIGLVELPASKGNDEYYSINEVIAVSFPKLNKDEKKDIVIIENIISHMGDSQKPFPKITVYIRQADGEGGLFYRLDDAFVNLKLTGTKSISEVKEFMTNYYENGESNNETANQKSSKIPAIAGTYDYGLMTLTLDENYVSGFYSNGRWERDEKGNALNGCSFIFYGDLTNVIDKRKINITTLNPFDPTEEPRKGTFKLHSEEDGVFSIVANLNPSDCSDRNLGDIYQAPGAGFELTEEKPYKEIRIATHDSQILTEMNKEYTSALSVEKGDVLVVLDVLDNAGEKWVLIEYKSKSGKLEGFLNAEITKKLSDIDL